MPLGLKVSRGANSFSIFSIFLCSLSGSILHEEDTALSLDKVLLLGIETLELFYPTD